MTRRQDYFCLETLSPLLAVALLMPVPVLVPAVPGVHRRVILSLLGEPPSSEHLPSRIQQLVWGWGRCEMPERCLGVRGTKGKFPVLSCSSEQGLQQAGLDLVKQEGEFKVHSFHSPTVPKFPSHCIDPLSLDSSDLLTGASAGEMNRG